MKMRSDVAKHRQNKTINLLARQVIDNDFSRDRVLDEIERMYVNITGIEKERLLSRVVERCYDEIWSTRYKMPPRNTKGFVAEYGEHVSEKQMCRCFAVRLCGSIIDCIRRNSFTSSRGGILDPAFYDCISNDLLETDMHREVADAELLLIYIKQAVIILKKAGVIETAGGVVSINDAAANGGSFYVLLFSSFWNRVRWESIFPSNPDAARELKKNKSILVDLMMRHRGVFNIESVANTFFDLTGFGTRNNMFLISFLDFYFFSWLRHFGLIEYVDSADHSPVSMYVTDQGKNFFRCLQSA